MKKLLPLLASFCVLFLAGCSQAQTYAEEKILQASGISADADYQEYKDLEASGRLNEQGLFRDGSIAQEGQRSGSVHVTFAENAYLKITYYYDEGLTQPVDTRQCYLEPGDRIYASEPTLNSPYSDKYRFSEFRLWQIDGEGRHSFPAPENGSPGLVLTVPADFTGTELSVEPLGRYESRTLTFRDYYLDSDGKEVELNGQWTADSVTTDDDSAQISPLVTYTVSYDFSKYCEDYYFDLSSPEDFYADDQKGSVVFSEVSPQSGGPENYELRLHRYISAKIINEGAAVLSALTSSESIKAIEVNGEALKVSGSKEQTIPKLKCGDKLTIQVGEAYLAASSLEAESGRAEIHGGYEYTFTVPDTLETEFSVTVSKNSATLGGYVQKTVSNGTISVTDENGDELSPGDEVKDDAKLTVTVTPAEGFCISGKKVEDNVYRETMKYKDYVSRIDAILQEHPITQALHVTLDSSDEYGTCVYTLNGEPVSGTVAVPEGEKIKLEYTLTDDGYEIVRENRLNAVVGNIVSKNKITVSIEITREMDGVTLHREDYISLSEK